MSGKPSGRSSAVMPSGGDVGEGGVGAVDRIPMTGRTGTIVMRSVSLFLTRGRKVSTVAKRQQSSALSLNQFSNHRKMPSGIKNTKVIESLRRKTKFSKSELESLGKVYKKMTTAPGQRDAPGGIVGSQQPVQRVEGIDRTIFRELLHNTFDVITEDTIVERMFCCWDRDNEGAIRLEPWVLGLDVILRGSQKDKVDFCFRVYDLNGDGFITKDEIFQLLKNCLIKQPGDEDPEEGVRDLSELTLKKLDVDRDGKISFQDYATAIAEEPLLLEAFGQCLPTEESCVAFLTTLQ